MEKSLPRKKWLIVLTVVSLIAILAVWGIIYLNGHLEEILHKQIELHESEDLKIEFSNVSINALTQSAEIDEVSVIQADSSGVVWQADIAQVLLQDLSLRTLISGNGILLDSLIVEDLDFFLHGIPKKPEKDTGIDNSDEAKSKMPVTVDGIRIGTTRFDFNPQGPGNISGTLHALIRNFHKEQDLPNFNMLFSNLSFGCSLNEVITPDSLYTIKINSISKEFGDRISVGGIEMTPNLSLGEFSKYYGWSKGMLEIGVEEILADIDLSRFPDTIDIPFSQVDGSKLSVRKDNRWPLPDRVTPLPQEILSDLPMKVEMDSVSIARSKIELSVIMEDGEEAQLKVENVLGHARIQSIDESEPAIELIANQDVMGLAPVEVKTSYHYGEACPFTFDLDMSRTDLSFMSGFLQKSIGIEITDGQLNRLQLQMKGNKYASKGIVIFEYDNLDIAAVNKETGKEKVVLNVLADALGSLVFWKENPSHDQLRTGEFDIERDIRKAFMAQWFDGLQAGIINVVAKINPMKAREEKPEKKKNHKSKKD